MIIGVDCSRAFGTQRTGTENYSYYVISRLLQLPEVRAYKIVLYTRPGAVIPDWAEHSTAEVVTVPYRYLWTQVGLSFETWKRKLDVLWIPAHTLPILRSPGIKTVVTIHGLEYKWLPEYNNMLQRWYLPLSTFYAARSAGRLIAVSEFTKKQLVEELAVSPEKIDVIYEGVEDNKSIQQYTNKQVTKFLSSHGIERKKYILFVGTLQPRKNLPALIKAYSTVKDRFPDIKLVVAGGKGWMTQEIFAAPTRYGVQESVIFTGRVSDVELSMLYTQALVYVQPSHQEGFGLPVLEAMKHGVPVIVRDGGALAEVVGEAGIVVSPTNFVDELTKAITTVFKDQPLRESLIAAGRRRVATFTWERAARETMKVLTK